MKFEDIPLTRLLREERFYILFGLAGLIALSWAYLVFWDMPMSLQAWAWPHFAMMFTMWAVMMVAMMVPSAMPMILLYSHATRKAKTDGGNLAPLFVFISGYIVAWTGFSLLAATLHGLFETAGIVTPMMISSHPWLTGGLLILAGIYQMSPLKDTCLVYCSHPVQFISKYWRTGTWGVFRMGLHHGLFCVGCCWALMMLLFVGGVMNLLWVAALAIFVLLEKVLPLPKRWGVISGGVLILAGLYLGVSG